MPPMMPPTPAQPNAPQPEPADESTSGEGYEICIQVHADGTFAVSKEPLDDASEAPDSQALGMAEKPDSTVPTFEDALRAALKIFKTNPVNANEETQFQSGHREVAPPPQDKGL